MTLSIITVSHRSERHLPRYVESFLASGSGGGGADIEFVLVENSDTTDTKRLLVPLREAGFAVRFVTMANRGFGAGCNLGAAHARGDSLIFANPDIGFVDPIDAIDQLQDGSLWGTVTQLDRTGQAYSFDVLPEHKTVLGELRRRYRGRSPAEPAWRTRVYPVGSFFVVAKALFDAVGGFDERFFMYHEEAELARRLYGCAPPPVCFDDIRIVHEAFGSEHSRAATMREETRGLLTYAQVTGERRILLTRAMTQMVLAPASSAARKRLIMLLTELSGRRARAA